MTIKEGMAGHGSHRKGSVCLECDRLMQGKSEAEILDLVDSGAVNADQAHRRIFGESHV